MLEEVGVSAEWIMRNSPLIHLLSNALFAAGVVMLFLLPLLYGFGKSLKQKTDDSEDTVSKKVIEQRIEPYKQKWQQEIKLWHALFYRPNAPLRQVQQVYQTAVGISKKTCATALDTAKHNRDHTLASDKTARDLALAEARTKRDQTLQKSKQTRAAALEQAKQQRDQDLGVAKRASNFQERSTLESRAYAQHRSAETTAYARDRETETKAYAIHRQEETAAWSQWRKCESDAWQIYRQAEQQAYATRHAIEQEATATRTQAAHEYLKEHPEFILQVLGSSGEADMDLAAETMEKGAYVTISEMELDELIARAREIIDNDEQIAAEEIAAIVAHLYVEARPDMRAILTRLISQLISRMN